MLLHHVYDCPHVYSNRLLVMLMLFAECIVLEFVYSHLQTIIRCMYMYMAIIL